MLGIRLYIILFVVFFVWCTGGLKAKAEEPEKPSPTAIIIKPLNIPVTKSGRTGNTDFITLYLVVEKKSHVQTACYWMPRIRDALMQSFYMKPLTWDHFNRLPLGVEDTRLIQTVHRALNRRDLVTRVHAVASVRMASNDAAWLKSAPITKCKEEKPKDKKDDKKKH